MRPAALIASFTLFAALAVPTSLMADEGQSPPAAPPQQAQLQDAAPAVDTLQDAHPAKQSAQPSAPPGRNLDNGQAGATASASKTVAIEDFKFVPKSLTVAAGTTVDWTNNGKQPHNVTGGPLKSKTLNHGDSYSFTFDSPGTYDYTCTIHPQMKAAIKVTGGSSGGGTNDGNSSGTGGTSAGSGTGGTSTGSTPSTSGTSSTPSSTGSSSGSSGSLASTGLDTVLLVEIGLVLLLGGLVLREVSLRRRRA